MDKLDHRKRQTLKKFATALAMPVFLLMTLASCSAQLTATDTRNYFKEQMAASDVKSTYLAKEELEGSINKLAVLFNNASAKAADAQLLSIDMNSSPTLQKLLIKRLTKNSMASH